ncbi:unnamed protein product [Paramecium sonneborni]|uniref:Calmodulin n=1 Tax=Paramecium sonneborni TaxID=65129 RepID=A0A8S1MP49_9CILI|nr:unnamed protein product [Paramecium sonneborni]
MKKQQQSKSLSSRKPQDNAKSVKKQEKLTKIQEAFNFNKASKYIFQSGFQERAWLIKRGYQDRIDFKDSEITELRKYFSSLDGDGSGAIGIEELEDPLIALGLVNSREEVEKIMSEVDEDGTNEIEFKEFLTIMRGVQKGGNVDQGEKNPIYDFFKKMSNGQLEKGMDKHIPFKLNVSLFRRKQILNAITGDQKEIKDKGQKILQAYKRQLLNYKQQDRINRGEDPNDISLDQFPNKDNGPNPRNGFPKLQRIIQPEQINGNNHKHYDK